MMSRHAQLAIALRIASGDEHVVDAGRGVLLDGEHRLAEGAEELTPRSQRQAHVAGPGVLHGKEVQGVRRTGLERAVVRIQSESEEINDLFAVRVDDP